MGSTMSPPATNKIPLVDNKNNSLAFDLVWEIYSVPKPTKNIAAPTVHSAIASIVMRFMLFFFLRPALRGGLRRSSPQRDSRKPVLRLPGLLAGRCTFFVPFFLGERSICMH